MYRALKAIIIINSTLRRYTLSVQTSVMMSGGDNKMNQYITGTVFNAISEHTDEGEAVIRV